MQAAASESYWCLVGSLGFGSISSVPVKPMRSAWSAAMRRNRPRWSSSRFMSVFSRV